VTGRSPARLLAPLALVAAAVALFAVVTSGGGDGSPSSADTPSATATATPKSAAKKKQTTRKKVARTYTVKPGDTPSSIAAAADVDLDDLLAANPDADPSALTVGEKLKLP
jgi:LysM repeat protein